MTFQLFTIEGNKDQLGFFTSVYGAILHGNAL